MEPMICINPWAVAAAVAVSFVWGSLWYGPLFGKAWARAAGFGDSMPGGGKEILRGILLNLLGTGIMAFVLAHDVAVWRPSVWNLEGDKPACVYGFFSGFFVWLGFVCPVLLNGVAFERKSWTLFAINAAYQFLHLQAMGMILAYWR